MPNLSPKGKKSPTYGETHTHQRRGKGTYGNRRKSETPETGGAKKIKHDVGDVQKEQEVEPMCAYPTRRGQAGGGDQTKAMITMSTADEPSDATG